jgi:hypothetical protein
VTRSPNADIRQHPFLFAIIPLLTAIACLKLSKFFPHLSDLEIISVQSMAISFFAKHRSSASWRDFLTVHDIPSLHDASDPGRESHPDVCSEIFFQTTAWYSHLISHQSIVLILSRIRPFPK